MRLCVIPARGGSKRIPRKNLKCFAGQPIIAWSINAALKSACFNRIIVSTDDPEISQVAKAYGAEVPFVRPLELSGDFTDTISVIAHAVDWQNTNGQQASEVCCIYATAPLLKPESIQLGLKILIDSGADFAFSVTQYAFPIQRAMRVTKNNRLQMLQPQYFKSRSQDLEESVHDAGQFYWGKAHSWLQQQSFFGSCVTVPVPLPRHRVQDIDTADDWLVAERMFKIVNNSSEEGL
jgi:pseudaminic acid cytidylyltransferase